MSSPVEFGTAELLTLALVSVRIGTLLLVAPVFGAFEAPLRMRLVLALVLAALVAPIEIGRAAPPPDTFGPFLAAAGGEALVGLILGIGVRLLFTGMHVAGQTISQLSGLHLSEVFDPTFQANLPLFSRLLLGVATAVFLAIGGHRLVIGALLDTYAWLPTGEGKFSSSAVDAVTLLFAQSFVLGARVAAPAIVALVAATLIVGLVSRTLPQLNMLALGLAPQALVGLAAVGLSLAGAGWVFQDQLQAMLESALYALKPQ